MEALKILFDSGTRWVSAITIIILCGVSRCRKMRKWHYKDWKRREKTSQLGYVTRKSKRFKNRIKKFDQVARNYEIQKNLLC